MQDLTILFADFFKQFLSEKTSLEERKVSPDNVFQPGKNQHLPLFKSVCLRLLKEGSKVNNFENLLKLHNLCKEGHSCLILSEHVSNFDVPNLFTLISNIENGKYENVFKDNIFIAGRKLNEESDYVKVLTESFTRVVITPKTSIYPILEGESEEEKLSEAMRMNRNAQKMIKDIKTKGYVFLLYPTGTRYRPWDEKTGIGLRETYNYIKNFEFITHCAIIGNTLPPMQREMIKEIPVMDTVVYNFSEIIKSEDFLNKYEMEFDEIPNKPEDADKKQFIVDKVMLEIKKLHNEIKMGEKK